jgi:hypothetical protein
MLALKATINAMNTIRNRIKPKHPKRLGRMIKLIRLKKAKRINPPITSKIIIFFPVN